MSQSAGDEPVLLSHAPAVTETYVRDTEEAAGGGGGVLVPVPQPRAASRGSERDIPIRLTGQPASAAFGASTGARPIATVVSVPASTSAGTQQEREPFLPARFIDSPSFENERPVSRNTPQLALVRTKSPNNDDTGDMPELQEDALVARTGWRYKLHKYTHVGNQLVREGLAEFLGSFILIVSHSLPLATFN